MRNFLWILAICLFSIFLSKNIASSDDLDHAYEMKDLMYDDSMNPSNLPICSGKLFKLCVGHLKYSNADYVGALKNNIPHGYGKIIYSGESAGQEYLGEWKNGEIHGQGMYILSDGGIREGIFIDGNFHRGIETTSRGNIMKGEFVDGKLHNGIFTPHASIFPVKITNSLTGFFSKRTYSSAGFSTYLLPQFVKDDYLDLLNNRIEVINGEAKEYPEPNTPNLLPVFLVGFVIIVVIASNFRLHFPSILMLCIGLILIDNIPIIVDSLDNPAFYLFFPAIWITIFSPLHRWRRNICPKCGTRPHFFGLGKFVEVEVQEGDKAFIPPRKYVLPDIYTVCPMCRHKWANKENSENLNRKDVT